MSREIYFDIKRKRVLERARQIHVEPKLSPEVQQSLKELYECDNCHRPIKPHACFCRFCGFRQIDSYG